MPPINRGAVWIGSKRKAALVGDVALANGSRRNSPGRHSAILLSCTHGTGKVEEVGRPRLRELHQRAVRAYGLVTFCDRLKEYVANLGGDQRATARSTMRPLYSTDNRVTGSFYQLRPAGGLADLDQEF